MIKKSILGLMLVFFLLSGGFALATPISLNYAISDIGGGLYNYEFSLVLDNHDNSWISGQSWNWLIFGDAPYGSISPLTDFVGDMNDLPVGTWTSYGYSQGGHNGPTFIYTIGGDFIGWVPTSVGETLIWSGTSTANLPQGQLLFSTLVNEYGAIGAEFEVVNLSTSVVPEPATLLLFGAGLAGLGIMRKKLKV
jgi:hypothetical protein